MFMRKYKAVLRGKRGSSLPMVLAIGLVLVIWVMALTPIITAQGKASIDVQNQEAAYLQSRSAIEFTKGELLNMVTLHGIPETFAVTYDGSVFTPKAWDDPDYGTYVSAQPSDLDDIPLDTENGKKVAAICAVEKPAGEKDYTIQVTTFNNGEAGLTYNTTYTPPVLSKMINPEAYKKTHALPLSDFVLVDGKIGPNTVWNSTLTDRTFTHTSYISTNSNGKFTSYKSGFEETFLRVTGDNYAGNAGSYPAVFKRTVGVPDDPDADANQPDTITFETPNAPSLSVKWAELTDNGNKLTVTLQSDASTALYCCTNSAGTVITEWQNINSFTINNASGEYFFYCYVPKSISGDGKTIYNESDVSTGVGVNVYTPNYSNKVVPTASGSYIMYTGSSSSPTTLGMTSGGALKQNTTPKQVYYNGAPVWKMSSNSEFSIYDSNYNVTRQLNCNSEKYQLGNSYQPLDYSSSNNTISKTVSEWWGFIPIPITYYLDISNTNFVSRNVKYTYFVNATTTLSQAPAAPAKPAAVQLSIAPPTSITEDTTLEDIKDYYKSRCPSWVQSPRVYICSVDGQFKAYVSGTDSRTGLYFLCEMPGSIQLKAKGYGVAGAALYLMGNTNAIDTEGKAIYLKADLLVIRDNIATGGGSVTVNPYSTSDTLAFFKSGSGPFKAYNFYRIPAGTNLLNVTAEEEAAWLVRDNTGECAAGSVVEYAADGVTVNSIVFPDKAIILETSSDFHYPVINFDIAYATDEQLAHVVSGEAARWTNNGVLSGVDNTPNGWYVVCPYVTSISGNVTRSANRIIMKSEAESLDVSGTVRLVSRYWSVDVPKITQTNINAEFFLYCLTSKENKFVEGLDWLSSFLGDIDYSSDTMQVDYERQTTIARVGSETSIDAQICRYENGTDLFDGATPEAQKQDLRIEYTIDDINNAFNSEALKATIVERYMHLTANRTDTLDLAGILLPRELKIYSNYISFDSSIKKISIWSPLGDSSFIVNSQETGYTEDEYLYLFASSAADTYTGTMLYFEGNIDVYRRWAKIHTIEAGFYYVPSGGTSILNLSSYKVSKDELDTYSKYINENDGSMSSAYVDTGFETEDATEGGFGGGSVN